MRTRRSRCLYGQKSYTAENPQVVKYEDVRGLFAVPAKKLILGNFLLIDPLKSGRRSHSTNALTMILEAANIRRPMMITLLRLAH